jgi:hypothetical protein
MSIDNYSFGFCKIILNRPTVKRSLHQKKGDTIAVPDYEDSYITHAELRKKMGTPINNHDKLSNSTISDFGNSFNSDMKSFLSINA